MKKLKDLEVLEIKIKNSNNNLNLLFDEIEIKNDHLGIISKLMRNNLDSLDKLIKNNELLSREEINKLINNKYSSLSICQYRVLKSFICNEDNNKLNPKLNQYALNHNWYSTWLENKILELKKNVHGPKRNFTSTASGT